MGQPNDTEDAVTQHMRRQLTSLLAKRDQIDEEIRVTRNAIWMRLSARAERLRDE